MLLALNALLYLTALTLAMAVVTPLPDGAGRRARVARLVLVLGGGLTVAAAMVLAALGLWFESALAGTVAILVVGACMWVAVGRRTAPAEAEDEDEDDDGGSLFKPPPPEPTKPEGGPSDDHWNDWSEFDAARAGWAREREPSGV
jgi:hypothetical protein